jgi:hypothetical protein
LEEEGAIRGRRNVLDDEANEAMAGVGGRGEEVGSSTPLRS